MHLLLHRAPCPNQRSIDAALGLELVSTHQLVVQYLAKAWGVWFRSNGVEN